MDSPTGSTHADTAESSGSKAPENQPATEQKESAGDHRLQPGGAHGVGKDPGMTGMDVDEMPWRVERPGQQNSGSPPEGVGR